MISIIIPAYNEENIIEKCLVEVDKKMKGIGQDYEIIVVEESNDQTPIIVEKLARKNKKIIHLHSNVRLGKGGAIERGIGSAKGEKIVFMDADLSTNLKYLKPLINELDNFNIVMGSRYYPSSKARRILLRLILSKIYSALFRLVFRLNFKDVQCGFKGFRKKATDDIVPDVRSKDFFWDTEFIYLAQRKGLKICEIPIEWKERKGGIKITIKMMKSLMLSSMRLFLRSL